MLERELLGRPRGTRPRPEKGAIAVEFALVLPVLLALIFGLIQYGLYFWSMQGGSSAAREAARRAAVSEPTSCTEFKDYVKARIGGVSSNAAAATVTRTYKRRLPAAPPAPASWVEFTPTVADPVKVGDLVSVSVRFQSYDMNFPFIPFINGGTVAQTADSRVEYVPYPELTVKCP